MNKKVGFVKKEEEEKEIKVSPSSPFAERERDISERIFTERERERELIVRDGSLKILAFKRLWMRKKRRRFRMGFGA